MLDYDDIFLSDLLDPPFTTVSQPIDELGKEAVKQMLQTIKQKDHKCENIILKPKLIVRESTKIFHK